MSVLIFDIIHCIISAYNLRYVTAATFFMHNNIIIIVIYISDCFRSINQMLKKSNQYNKNLHRSMAEFIQQHNDLCRLISKIDVYLGKYLSVTLAIHIPINVISVNTLSNIKSTYIIPSTFLFITTIIEIILILSIIALMIPINQQAIAGRLTFHSSLARGCGYFYRSTFNGQKNYPLGIYSFVRFHLKCQNYLERFASCNIQNGIHLKELCITHVNFWNVSLESKKNKLIYKYLTLK